MKLFTGLPSLAGFVLSVIESIRMNDGICSSGLISSHEVYELASRTRTERNMVGRKRFLIVATSARTSAKLDLLYLRGKKIGTDMKFTHNIVSYL